MRQNAVLTVSQRKHPLTNPVVADQNNESQNDEGLTPWE